MPLFIDFHCDVLCCIFLIKNISFIILKNNAFSNNIISMESSKELRLDLKKMPPLRGAKNISLYLQKIVPS